MDLRPLQRRDFRLLYLAQLISLLGSTMTYVALPYQIYHLTHSALAVGLLGLVELIPLLVTALLGGLLADASDRRGTILLTEASLALASALLLGNALLPRPRLFALYVAAGLISALNGLQRPSLEAMTPRLVPASEISAASSLTVFLGSAGMIAGPAVGGSVIALSGVGAAYGADLLSYVASFALFRLISTLPPPEGVDKPSLRALIEGFSFARRRQELVGTYVVDFVAMVFGMPLALFPALAEGLGGPRVLGALYSAPALGSLLASLCGRWTARVRRQGAGVLLAAGGWGLAIVAFGFCRTAAPALLLLVLAGAADAVSGVFRLTIWNETIPDAMRGRLAALAMVSCMSGPLLGHAEAGAVAALAGVRASVVSGGGLCVLGVALCALALPRFRAYESRTLPVQEEAPVPGL